jgi:hypothetical protein
MKVRLSRAEFRRRVEELGQKLAQLERRVSNPEDTQEIVEARRRYDEMWRRLDSLPEDEDGPGALESDYEGLVDSVGRWMARQDAGRR